ncbi:protein kinase domain protein [Oxobacter pfennigii]|uniref:Protein kinase domain protein n=1 Tax=Oxobacter pfennigii TaxID=36849 RepID=A0A0P8X4N3_9CLOT|nr:hypothetical protein [Oxobacter pfennigii]KPU45737.1 protein kinase domain protein [Oxobacter pfennigii]
MENINVYDSNKNKIILGDFLGRGGEGSVYEVAGNANLAAKIYHDPLNKNKEDKLKAMTYVKSEKLLNVLAWPVDTLYNADDNSMVGILMPMVKGYKEIHKLYNPGVRIAEFPHAGWDFLIRTASNLARAFSVVHKHDHVIGDINPGNIVVSSRATVMLIDTDSFQVSAYGNIYPCNVGVTMYQPPELQDIKSFEGLIRTSNHDNFGLAVFIFQLIFMGRHPFSAKYTGSEDMTLEQAIKEKRFAYMKESKSRYMRQPLGTLSINGVSDTVAKLFERAFLTSDRPDGKEWSISLEEMLNDLIKCTKEPSHKYYKSQARCPWCRMEGSKEGVLFFGRAAGQPDKYKYTDVEDIWRSIASLNPPEPFPDMPEYKDLNLKLKSARHKLSRKVIIKKTAPFIGGIGFILAAVNMTLGSYWMVAAGILFAAAVFLTLKPALVKCRAQTDKTYNDTVKRLDLYLSIKDRDTLRKRFIDKKEQLALIYESYKDLEQKRKLRLKETRTDKNKYKIVDILDRELIIESSKIEKELKNGMEQLEQLRLRAEKRKNAVCDEIKKCIDILERSRA